jgi:UDP-glucose 4-epimerase
MGINDATILITGATGFVGKAVSLRLPSSNLITVGRQSSDDKRFFRKNINGKTNYTDALNNVDIVIHIAGRAHVMNETCSDPLAEFREANTSGTLNLARQAASYGVERFIFISSIKVNGEMTQNNKKFKFDDFLKPMDAYGQSKAEAELGLKEIANDTGMEVVIIRPPLVYGPGVKANFAAMMNLAKRNIPLPLGATHNRRSLVALDNLVDLIITCIDHPKAANQTFLVSDDNDVSTTELLQMMTRAAGKKPMLLPIPLSWLKFASKLIGKQAVIDRLCGNLQIDMSHTKETLDWQPPITVDEGIKRCFIKEELR